MPVVLRRALLALLLVALIVGSTSEVAAEAEPMAVQDWPDDCPVPPAAEWDGGGFEWLAIHAPDRVAVDHPILVGITAESDNLRMRTDVDMVVRVLYENQTVFKTDSVHEHDGLHTFVFTPDRPGVWTVQVDEPREDRFDTFTRHVQVCTPELAEWESLAMWRGIDGDLTAHDLGLHILLNGSTHGHPMLGLFDIRDPDGRLGYSGWNGDFHAMHAEYDMSRPGTAELFILPDMTAEEAVWTQRKNTTWDGSGKAMGAAWDPFLAAEECQDPQLHLVTEPKTIQQGTLTWQADSDLRFALLDDLHRPIGGRTTYTLERIYTVPGGLQAAPFWDQWVVDPFAAISTRMPGPGHYILHATSHTTGQSTCVEFFVVPNTAVEGPGIALADLQTNLTGVTVSLSATNEDDPLPNYQFDTRVYRHGTDDAPGSLVWMGKLHAPVGRAAFSLLDLAPGDYEVITYPSPQGPAVPAVATDDPAGFRWDFTIEGPRGINLTETEPEPEEALLPTLTPLVPLLVVSMLLALRRRDR